MAFAILRTSKLKTMGEIGGSLAHTYRTIPTQNADSARTHLNEHDSVGPTRVRRAIEAVLPKERRKDAVLCIEHLITASPEWDGWGTSKESDFFERSKEWLKKTYGEKNLISTSVHRDETTPHLVAYVVPLKTCETRKGSGRYCERLAAKDWLGGKKRLSAMQTSFAEKVADLGLQRGLEGSKAEHQSVSAFYAKIKAPTEKMTLRQWAEMEIPDTSWTESKAAYGKRVLEQANEKFNSYLAEIQKDFNSAYEHYQMALRLERDRASAEKQARLRAEDALLKMFNQVEELKENINKINELNDEKIAKLEEKYSDFDTFHVLYPSEGVRLDLMLQSKIWNHPDSVADREYKRDQELARMEDKNKPQPKPEPKPQPNPEPIPEPKPQPNPEPIPEPKPQPNPEPIPKPKPQPNPEPIPKPKPQPKPQKKRDDSLDFGM